MAVYHPVVSAVKVSGQRILIYRQSITRYLGLVVNTIAHWRYKSIPIPKNPTYSCKDVTIILPTISTDVKELRQTIQSMLDCNPSQILLITTTSQYNILQKFSKSMNTRKLKVLESPVASKRFKSA
jgi:hypothetical protein